MNYKKLIETFENAKPGFITFLYTAKNGETSKKLFNIGTSYEQLKLNDINTLDNLLIPNSDTYIPSEKYTRAIWNEAVEQKLQSLKTPQVKEDNFISVTKNSTIQYNANTGELYISGRSVKSTIVEEGEYKEVNSKPLTIAKRVIEKNYLTTSKWRKLNVKNLAGNLKISGDTIEIE
jgi:hypothetical protein